MSNQQQDNLDQKIREQLERQRQADDEVREIASQEEGRLPKTGEPAAGAQPGTAGRGGRPEDQKSGG